MAIYKRCSKCNHDHTTDLRKCIKCGFSLGDKFRVRIKDTASGKWISRTTPTLKAAREIETKFKLAVIEGDILPLKRKPSPAIAFTAYLNHAKITKKTWKDDEQRWNRHVHGKDYLTNSGILNIIKSMQEAGTYQPATILHVLKLIKRVYNWHIAQGLWSSPNPCDSITLPKFDNRLSQPLSLSEVSSLISYLASHHNRRSALVILFALFTGRRKGEILSLTWKDVNFDLEVITCRDTKNGETIIFPLNRSGIAILREARSIKNGDLVFPSSAGCYYKNSFDDTWKRLRARLIKEQVIHSPIRFHDLRHTYASHLASSGKVDIYTLKKLMGHKSISLTERYSHLIDGHLRRSTEVLDGLY